MLSPKHIVLPPVNDAYLSYPYRFGQWFVYDVKKNRALSFATCRDGMRCYWEGYDSCSRFIKPVVDPISEHIGLANLIGFDIELFAALWDDLETHLQLTDKTIVYPVKLPKDKPQAMILHLSPFWRANETVRSFATLFIRGIACHPGKTFKARMSQYTLANKIKPAIAYFLTGHTKPTFDKLTSYAQGYPGVISEFYRLTPAKLAAKLVKP